MGNYLITMPDVGEGIAEVEIVELPLAVGDTVEEDDLLCVVMTDKATVEIPSPVDGKITWLCSGPGSVIAVGADLVRLQVEGEGNIKAAPSVEPATTEPAPQEVINHPAEPPVTSEDKASNGAAPAPASPRHVAPRAKGEKPIASPAVRQRARDAGIDLRFVHGTGPAKRINHADLDAYIAANNKPLPDRSKPAADTRIKEIKVLGLRRKIAAIMQDTMQRIPHYTYVEEVDVTELELLRQHLNSKRRDDQPKLTMLPFIIKALVNALKEFPQMGSRFDDEAEVLYQYGAAHIGIATQTSNGLLVPVVKHAETMGLWQSAAEIKRLAKAARGGGISREELTGSNITITSLGPLGGIVTTPVINSPEVAIVGINKVAKRPVWQDGGFVPRDIMHLSSSFDHRIIDGWEATQFIHTTKRMLESPATLFIEHS